MIKKCLLIFILLGIFTGIVFAQSESESQPKSWFSIGAGGYFANDFGGGFENSSSSSRTVLPYTGGGFFAFFDATFAELSLGMFAGNGDHNNGVSPLKRSIFGIDFGLLGKFPFHLGEKFSLFPLLGIEYHLVITAMDSAGYQFQNNNVNAPLDLSALWFKAGAGIDISFNEILYLRGEVLYGIRLPSKYENDSVNSAGSGSASLIGHGLNIKIALGYRFY